MKPTPSKASLLTFLFFVLAMTLAWVAAVSSDSEDFLNKKQQGAIVLALKFSLGAAAYHFCLRWFGHLNRNHQERRARKKKRI